MNQSFFSSSHCTGRTHCSTCRAKDENGKAFRADIARNFDTGGVEDFACPHGMVTGNESQGLGDTIAKITKAVGIKPCTPCEERRKRLNQLVPYKGTPA